MIYYIVHTVPESHPLKLLNILDGAIPSTPSRIHIAMKRNIISLPIIDEGPCIRKKGKQLKFQQLDFKNVFKAGS